MQLTRGFSAPLISQPYHDKYGLEKARLYRVAAE